MILYVVGQLSVGGLERQLTYLISHLRGYHAEVAVWRYDPTERYAIELNKLGIRLHGFSPDWSRMRKLRALFALAREVRPQLMHSYSFATNCVTYVAARLVGAGAIGSIRSNFTRERLGCKPFGLLSARWPSFQIANSYAARETAMRIRDPFRPTNVAVVPNGVDLDRFRATGPLPEVPCILAVGRLSPVKRWDRLVTAVKQLRDMGLEFRVRLVGDGPSRPDILRMVKAADLQNIIGLLGERKDIPELLNSSSFLTLTSEHEGCPNVVLEAMAAGRAVVTTDAGDSPYLVEDGRTGFVVKRGDDDALVGRMRQLLSSPEMCEQFGSTGRRRAVAEFGMEVFVSKVLSAYREAGWIDRSADDTESARIEDDHDCTTHA